MNQEDRINKIINLAGVAVGDDLTRNSLIKGTTVAKLCEFDGPGYKRVVAWYESKLLKKSSTTTFLTGAMRDSQEGKPDFVSTISWTAFNRYARYMTKQAEKYGGGTFKKGIPVESYEKSLVRHIDKYMRNKYESGSDELEVDHLCAILFNVFGLIHEEEQVKLKTKK